MKSVVLVAEVQSFTGAAERLRTTTQMVSKHVKAFEERLGVRVFDRTTRRVRVTDMGQAVVERCRLILEAVDELEASVQDGQKAPKGRIRIAAPLTFGEMYVAPQLSSFRVAFPEVEVSLLLTDRFINLVEEGVDATIRIGHLDDSSLVARRLAETETVFVASPGYLDEWGRPFEPKDLVGHEVVHDDNWRGGLRWPFKVGGRAQRLEVKPALRVNSARAVHDLVAQGAGTAMLPRFAASASLREGRLERILDAFAPPPFPIHLMFLHSHLLTARVRSFAEHLAAALSRSEL